MGCKISYTVFPLLNAQASIYFRDLYQCLLEVQCLISISNYHSPMHFLLACHVHMACWYEKKYWKAITSINLSECPWSVKNYRDIQNWRRTTNTMNTLLQWFGTAIQLATYPVQLLQQCKTSAYETPSYLCGHVECMSAMPSSQPHMWLSGVYWRPGVH